MDIKDSIQWYLTTVKVGLIKQLQEKNFNLSGGTANSINAEIMDVAGISRGVLTVPKHFLTLVEGIGRKPGTMPPVQEIAEWVRKRNLDISPWAIAINMKNKGNAVYRKERRGIELDREINAHRGELLRRIAEGVKAEIFIKYKTTK
jgi:hypothetical protein